MKNTLFRSILFSVIIITILSCSDGDDSSNASLSGSWKVVSKQNFNCTLASDNSQQSCGTYAYCYTITFNGDGTFELERTSDGAYLGVGDFIYAQDRLTLTFTHNPAGYVGTNGAEVSISGNTMTTTEVASSCSVKMTYEKL